MFKLSACCFIRNTFEAPYMLPESMCQFLHLVDEMVIMDLGSTDGTLEFLKDVSKHNPKVSVISEGSFPHEDASVFADLANVLIDFCKNENIIYWQSDELFNDNLLNILRSKLKNNEFDLSFWRIQFANNFQYPKWYPHLVHRVGKKGSFNFVGDGMNTNRAWDAKICSNYGGEMFPQWGGLGPEGIKPFIKEMIVDVSLIGGFRDSIPARRKMHLPFWHEDYLIPYYDKNTGKQPMLSEHEWMTKALNDADWLKKESPYDLPALLKYHVGRTTYKLRPELLEAIKRDKTHEYILSLV